MSGPKRYTPELAARICAELASGRKLKEICAEEGMPKPATVLSWVQVNRDGFAARYRDVRACGRPSVYTPEIAERICAELCTGRSLLDVCRDEGMPLYSTVSKWASRNWEGFAEPYRSAREIGLFALADELLDIADDSRNDYVARRRADGSVEHMVNHEHISRSRVRIETRRWLLSKGLPKIFGDRIDLTASPESVDTLREVMKEIDGRTRGLPDGDQDANQ